MLFRSDVCNTCHWYRGDRGEDEEFSEAHKDIAVLRCTSFQGRKRDTDIETKHGIRERGRWDELGD